MTEPGRWAELMAMAGVAVKLDVMGEEVVMKKSDLGVAASTTVAGPPTGKYIEELVMKLIPNANSPEWLVSPEAYAPGVVGNKSASLGYPKP